MFSRGKTGDQVFKIHGNPKYEFVVVCNKRPVNFLMIKCCLNSSFFLNTKGQLISECLFEIIVGILVQTIFSKRHFEIN